jgi:hypothetical protein
MKKYIILLVALVLGACGTRKVETGKTKEISKIETADVQERKVEIETNIKTITIAENDEIEITPIDNARPVIINGKRYENALIRYKKNKANVDHQESKKESIQESKQIKIINTNDKVIEAKATEKKNYVDFYIAAVIVVLVLVFGFFRMK